MRHRSAKSTLGRTAAPRRALFRSLLTSMATHGRIRTTEAKAKALRPKIERLITVARRGTLAARRQLQRDLTTEEAVRAMLTTHGARFKNRQGGYTRIIKTSRRAGDGARMALLTFVE